MAIELPKSRLNVRSIQQQKRNVPLEQIIAVEGQNPLATGVQTAGNVIGQALNKRLELQQQGQQLAQLASLTGQDIPQGNGLSPDQYIKGLETKSVFDKLNAEGKKKPLGTPFTGEDGQNYQYFYDEKNQKTTAELLPKGLPGVKPEQPENKQFIGLDHNGKPLLLGTKSGKITTGATPNGGTVLPKNNSQPTSQTRSTAEFANTIIPHIQDMRGLIQEADAKGYIGPMSGRVYNQFLAGKVGSTGNPDADYLLGKLRATDSLLKTGTMKVHFGSRGGSQMYDHFSDLLNSGKQSAAQLNGSLDGIESFMQGYANAGNGKQSLSTLPPAGTKKIGRFNVEVSQ